MLHFLKTHQRKFLIVIAVVIISSFVFFGTFSTFIQPGQGFRDKEIVKGVTGKPLMKKDLYALCQLLTTSVMNPGSSREGGMPNLLNDGVIEKELLTSGMSMQMAHAYFPQLKEDLEARLKKIQSYRHYVHPHAPHVNAMAVWQRFAPVLVQHLDELKKSGGECSAETLALLFQLYLDQAHLPPEMLKQILLFQQQQFGLPQDPRLPQANLALFGFTTLEEWFGPLFVELNAQFIANAAALAEQRGYSVKIEEIRTDLFQNIYSGYKQLARNNATFSGQEVLHYFQRKTQQLGLDEKMTLDAWRKIMLFRRLFADVGGSVLLDPLSYQHFQKFSKESVKIALYEIPAALQLRDFQSLLKFQIYLEGISPTAVSARSALLLPGEAAGLEQIEKLFPELLQRESEVEYAEIKKSALAGQISLKETWEWEAADANWDILAREFSELKESAARDRAERLKVLDALDAKRRLAVDNAARLHMLDAMPDRLKAALITAEAQKEKISMRVLGGSFPFAVKNRAALLALLDKAPISEEGAPLAADDPLYFFTDDREHYYRIKVLQRDAAKRVMAFAEVRDDGTLDLLLNQRLEEAYPEIRKKHPGFFQLDKGGWKPLKEVKDQVGRYLFGDLLKAIEESYKKYIGTLPGNPGELPLLFYSQNRFLSYVEEIRRGTQSGQVDPRWIKTGEESAFEAIADQWRLCQTERIVKRSDGLSLSKEEMFALEPEQWSKTNIGAGGALAFYKVLTKDLTEELPADAIKQGHEILALDARKQFMKELLAQIAEKKAIDISQSLKGEVDEH
ncbi:MAG TPA: hypothetical protein VGJ00_10560 [Rhabdochlamydiaceae bacterium]|jgi:GcvH upstream region-like protein